MFPPTNSMSEMYLYMKRELAGLYDDEEIHSMCFMLIEEYCGFQKSEVLANPDHGLTESEMLRIHFAVKELKKHRPLQHILSKAWFYDMELKVSPDVLIPRPETEELVEWVIHDLRQPVQPLRIIDIGTGSGCIALALAKNLPAAEIVAADISDQALAVARENAAKLDCRIDFRKMDIRDDFTWDLYGVFDIIVSNPPYVRPSEKHLMKAHVLDHEPAVALFVTEDDPLIFYRTILNFAAQALRSGGSVYFETSHFSANDALDISVKMGFVKSELRKDINGKYRMLRCRK